MFMVGSLARGPLRNGFLFWLFIIKGMNVLILDQGAVYSRNAIWVGSTSRPKPAYSFDASLDRKGTTFPYLRKKMVSL